MALPDSVVVGSVDLSVPDRLRNVAGVVTERVLGMLLPLRANEGRGEYHRCCGSPGLPTRALTQSRFVTSSSL